jgi:tetratricopeptide (TPR) repeat protein
VGLIDGILRWRAGKLLERGRALLRDGEIDEALRVAERLRGMRYSGGFELTALAHAARGRTEEAVRVLEEGVEAAPQAWLNWQLLGNYRSDLGRFAGAEAAYERALACPGVHPSSVRLNQAILAYRQGENPKALGLAALVDDPELRFHPDLLAMIREIHGLRSGAAQHFRLVVHGRIPETSPERREAQGFYTTYDVVADTPDEALGFARALDTRGPAADWTLDEAKAVEPRPGDLKGVYSAGGRIFYEEEG